MRVAEYYTQADKTPSSRWPACDTEFRAPWGEEDSCGNRAAFVALDGGGELVAICASCLRFRREEAMEELTDVEALTDG